MTVTDVRKDTESLTMTIACEYDAAPERVWQLWADPRKLERWWGPPTYPATVEEHDLRAGGTVRYFMTGPEGDKHAGGWRVLAVDPPHRLEVEDFFVGDDDQPDPDLPTTGMTVTISARADGGAVMTITSSFASAEQLQQLLDMGVEEGMKAALGQTDALLAD
ncbi:MAG TPA: SRPBCC domain-containing protein [Acidimicrobiales bacterium]